MTEFIPIGPNEPYGYPVEVDDDGCLFNPETGELYDPAEVETLGLLGVLRPEALERFEINDLARAEWALARRAEIEADLLALKARFVAIETNYNRQARDLSRRLSWWDFRFFSGIANFARRMLPGKKKTWQGDNGKVSFRTVPGSPSILDDSAAIEWAETYAPSIVQRKVWVTATAIRKAIADVEKESEMLFHLDWFAMSEPRESITIKTGVEKEGRE